MALFGLLGGGDGADPLDIYGDLFTDKQKAALRQKELSQSLFRMSEALGKAAQPSPYKPSLGSMAGSLGAGLGAFGSGGDETMNKQLQAMQIAEKVRQSRSQRELMAKLDPLSLGLLERQMGVPPGTYGGPKGGLPAGLGAPGAAASSGMPSAPLTPTAPPGAPPPAPTPPSPPASMGLPAPGMSPFGLPDAPGAVPAGPPPVLDSPITPAERLEWQKTVGPSKQYLPLEDWVAKQRASPPGGPITPPPPPLKTSEADPNSQFAGLLSGGLDQLVGQDGQPLTGQGVLPSMLASYTGGTPGGMPPFQPTPTSDATPGADGLDEVIPSGPRLQRSDLTNVAAPAGAFEQAANYLQKELGLQPHQARGAARWMQNVESGLDPNIVNPTSGAFGIAQHLGPRKRALTAQYGANPSFDQQLAFIKDELQGPEKAALNSLRNTSTENEAFRTWGKDFERPSPAEYAKATGRDYVIPSGRGIPASALTNVADTGAPGGGGAPTASGGVIPGLGVTPEALATLNGLMRRAGIEHSPFDSILETYYKSPGYLGEKTRIEQQATKDVGLVMDPKIAAETARQTQKYIQENEAHKSGLELARDLIGKGVYLDKETNTMKPITNAAEAMAAIDAAKPTADIKEYEYYRKQELAAGQIPDPFQKWDASRRKASATTINTAEGFDAAQTKARVGVDAKIAQDLAEQAITGRRLMPVLDELAYLADKTPEGWKGPLAITTGRTLAGFGITVPPGASNAEAFQALAQRLVPVVREPGATSQGEMNLYLNAGPSLAGTADGRRLIIDINRSMIQRSQEIAKVYRENIGKPDLYEKLAELDKPLFSTEQRAAMEGASKARAAAPSATAAPPGAAAPTAPTITGPNGEKLVLSPDGKQWVPQ